MADASPARERHSPRLHQYVSSRECQFEYSPVDRLSVPQTRRSNYSTHIRFSVQFSGSSSSQKRTEPRRASSLRSRRVFAEFRENILGKFSEILLLFSLLRDCVAETSHPLVNDDKECELLYSESQAAVVEH